MYTILYIVLYIYCINFILYNTICIYILMNNLFIISCIFGKQFKYLHPSPDNK